MMENPNELSNPYQYTEVSKMEWKSFDQAMNLIRPYNLEKKEVMIRVEKMLNAYKLYDIM